MDTNEPESASCRLLATYELLENILSHLSTGNLAQSQRVCRTWKDLIMRSQLLRRHLFLEPTSHGKAKSTNNSESQGSRMLAFERHPILLKDGCRDNFPTLSGSRWYCELNLLVVKRMRDWIDKQWTTMLMTQPPLKEVEVVAWTDCVHRETCQDSNGIKMGVLWRAIDGMSQFVDEYGAYWCENDFTFSVDIKASY